MSTFHENVSILPASKQLYTLKELRRNGETQIILNSLLRLSLEDMTLEKLLRMALDLVTSIPWLSFQSKGGVFLVDDREPEVLRMVAQNGLAKPLLEKCQRVPFGRCLCGRAALQQEIIFAAEVNEAHETRYDGIVPHGHYCVPIAYSGKILGVLNLYVREGHQYSKQEEEFLAAVADTLAGIIVRKGGEKALNESLQRMRLTLDGTVNALATIAEKRDPYTAGHQQRVAALACAIGREMNLDHEKVEATRIAATLHDIGKISVPSEILTKPGVLTDIEWSMIRCHPEAGYEILKGIPFTWPVATIVRQHHERIDGSGYPDGLSGRDILLEAKILAVADVVEAMVSHRPYRPARGVEKAFQEITRNANILYDPRVVEACLNLFNSDDLSMFARCQY
jgi:putative nucleotidyltransferase with HDIG domain